MSFIKSVPCLVCGVKIERGKVFQGHTDDELTPTTNLLSEDWEGLTLEIEGGFSSEFDCKRYHAVICPPCMRNALPRVLAVKNIHPRTYEYAEEAVALNPFAATKAEEMFNNLRVTNSLGEIGLAPESDWESGPGQLSE